MIRFKSFTAYQGEIDEKINRWLETLDTPINIIRWKITASDRGRLYFLLEYEDMR